MKHAAAFAILLSACTSQLTKPGSQVEIVTTLPPGPLLDLGDVVIGQPWQFKNDEEDARDRLRNYAARDGADLVLLQSQGREPCEVDAKKSCLFLRGHKYRRAEATRPSTEL